VTNWITFDPPWHKTITWHFPRTIENRRVPIPKALANKIEGKPEETPVQIVAATETDLRGARCRVCLHPQKSEIEDRFATMRPQGIARWLIEHGYLGVPASLIKKHFDVCVVGDLFMAKNGQQSAESFRNRIDKLVTRLEGYLDEFDEQEPGQFGKDWKGLSAVANQLRASLELLGKASGHIGPDNVIQIIESPQFQAFVIKVSQVTVQCDRCGPLVEAALDEEK
jgi:hypothetical protein